MPRRQEPTQWVGFVRKMGTHEVAFANAAAELRGINRTDYECLHIIDAQGSTSPGRLSRLTGLSSGAISGVLDRLEDAGYIRRIVDPSDRRRVIVEPVLDHADRRSDEVQDVLDELHRQIADSLKSYSARDRNVLETFAGQLMAILEQQTLEIRMRLDSRRRVER